MVLCCSLTVRALSLFQIVQRGVHGGERVKSKAGETRGENEGRVTPFSPFQSSLVFYFFVDFSPALFNLNVWNRLARPEEVFV